MYSVGMWNELPLNIKITKELTATKICFYPNNPITLLYMTTDDGVETNARLDTGKRMLIDPLPFENVSKEALFEVSELVGKHLKEIL